MAVSVGFDWGFNGIKRAVRKGDIIIVVDILRFTSTAVTATANDFTIYPSSSTEETGTLLKKYNAQVASKDPISKYSLSPLSFLEKSPENVILVSPNGAKCSRLASNSKHAFVGAFLNMKSIGRHVSALAKKMKKNVTVVGAGEITLGHIEMIGIEKKLVNQKNKEYFCLEDMLGSGGIISEMRIKKTEKALFAEKWFKKTKDNLVDIVSTTVGGRHLIETGRKNEVEFCLFINKYPCVPKIEGDKIIGLH